MAKGLLQVSLEESISFEQIGQQIQMFIKSQSLQPGQWIFAKGYDHNRLIEKRHPDRWKLDQWAPENPLVLQHQSGHVGVFNSAHCGCLVCLEIYSRLMEAELKC